MFCSFAKALNYIFLFISLQKEAAKKYFLAASFTYCALILAKISYLTMFGLCCYVCNNFTISKKYITFVRK